jgi:hypothetical protein
MAKQPKGSPRYRLNIEDLHSIKRGFLIGVSGVILTYLTLKSDFVPIEYEPFLWVIYASLVNLARLWLKDNTKLKGGIK